jgi:hypothetical protein
VIDLSAVRLAHRRFLAKHDAILAQSLEESRQQGLAEVRRNPGFKPRTGALQRATTGRVVRTRTGAIVRLQNRKAYAAAIDRGSKAHVIQVRRRKALRFIGSGGVVFRRRVNHPGTKPYRFLSRAVNEAGRLFGTRFVSRIEQAARSF